MSPILLISVIIIIVIGFWANNTYATPGWKKVFNVALIVILLLIILYLLGWLPDLKTNIR